MRGVLVSLAALALIAGLFQGGPSAALAQEGLEENIRVIQQRPFLRKGRVEVAPYFALVTNENLFWHLGAGGVINYHILENLSVGLQYTKYFSFERDLYQSVQDDFRVFPEKYELDFYAGGHVAYVPFYGKFVLVGSAIVHWDAYVIAGAGVTRTSRSDWAVTGNFGAGTRLFLTKWLTFNIEVRDYIMKEEYLARSEIVNNVILHTGLSFFIPFGFDYRYPK